MRHLDFGYDALFIHGSQFSSGGTIHRSKEVKRKFDGQQAKKYWFEKHFTTAVVFTVCYQWSARWWCPDFVCSNAVFATCSVWTYIIALNVQYRSTDGDRKHVSYSGNISDFTKIVFCLTYSVMKSAVCRDDLPKSNQKARPKKLREWTRLTCIPMLKRLMQYVQQS